MSHASLGDVIAEMEAAFPPSYAEGWDSVGLICGDPTRMVGTVHFALDPVAATVDEALTAGADLLITHHPLYLRGTDTVSAATPKGALIHRLIEGGCALFNAHTNGDAANEGTAVVLADLFELTEVSVVEPSHIGEDVGLGRMGRLPHSMRAAELGRLIAQRLPATARGVALGGDPQRMVEWLAVCPGAGDSSLERVRALGADAMLTSDLRHHPAQEALAYEDSPVLFDAAHFATESPWLARAATVLERAAAQRGWALEITVSSLTTDPWTTLYLPEGSS
ncbi:MAG: Nif3-like dinuclear metal center hexameric protein [Bowdeniella nasicola]|nr:Nif3-like dinuclear metal center hexameric protein [Bowdeniella nasicola]